MRFLKTSVIRFFLVFTWTSMDKNKSTGGKQKGVTDIFVEMEIYTSNESS